MAWRPVGVGRSRQIRLWVGGSAVAALGAILCLSGIGSQPFYTKGEPREALVVWEMAHGGGLVLPLRNGTEIPSKPPLYHWLALATAQVTGRVDELAARLPSALLSIGAVLAVYAFGATAGPLRAGWLASIALLLDFEWLRASRTARVDMTLTFFVTAALLLFARMERRGFRPLSLAAFYASVAAATLAKGPVGIALPAAVLVVHAALAPGERGGLRARLSRARSSLARLAPVRGLAAVLALAGAWYLAAWAIAGEPFLVKHVLKENVFRVLDPDALQTGHRHGPAYLVVQTLLGAMPWSLLVPGTACFLWRARPLDPTRRYLAVWFVTVLVFFSIPASKRSVYALPAYPAGALLLGLTLGPGPEDPTGRRWTARGLLLTAGVLAVLGVACLLVAAGVPIERAAAPFASAKDLQGAAAAAAALRGHAGWTALAGLLALGGAGLISREAPGGHWLRASLGAVVAMTAVVLLVALPCERAIARSRTLAPFARRAAALAGERPLSFYRSFDYGVVFYAGRHIGTYDGPLDAADAPALLLMWEDEATRLDGRVRVLARSSGKGPKGRARMALAAPRPAMGPSNEAGSSPGPSRPLRAPPRAGSSSDPS